MELKLLFIEDDEKLGQNLKKSFDGEKLAEHSLKVDVISSFEDGIDHIVVNDIDLVILDLYKDKDDKDENAGVKVLDQIRQTAFVPVVFFTGYAYKISSLVSEIVGVVSKGDGIDALSAEIERVITSKLALLKPKIYNHLREALRQYFWETVDAQKNVFVPNSNDASIGYLLLRRFANSLSKENIRQLLEDDKIKEEKVHPMEFYIFPTLSEEYEAGEILVNDQGMFVLLTPSCDFVPRVKNETIERKVGFVLLAKVIPLSEFDSFKRYQTTKSNDAQNRLRSLITNNQSDRFFFLPGTPFIENGIVDFQNKIIIQYEELKGFNRLAKLDDPFAQSMISSFIRYYNRVGSPDVDTDYVINNL